MEEGPLTGMPEGNRTAGAADTIGLDSEGVDCSLGLSTSDGGRTASARGFTTSSNFGHGATVFAGVAVAAPTVFAGLFGGGCLSAGGDFLGEGDMNLGFEPTPSDIAAGGEPTSRR